MLPETMIYIEVDGKPCHFSNVLSSYEDEHIIDLLLENEGAMISLCILYEDNLGRPQNNKNIGQQEEEGMEEAISNLES